jgi:hypothetical protein
MMEKESNFIENNNLRNWFNILGSQTAKIVLTLYV